eukprot:scaffold8499_cov99-Isochrysis_galbana.AAC.3
MGGERLSHALRQCSGVCVANRSARRRGAEFIRQSRDGLERGGLIAACARPPAGVAALVVFDGREGGAQRFLLPAGDGWRGFRRGGVRYGGMGRARRAGVQRPTRAAQPHSSSSSVPNSRRVSSTMSSIDSPCRSRWIVQGSGPPRRRRSVTGALACPTRSCTSASPSQVKSAVPALVDRPTT